MKFSIARRQMLTGAIASVVIGHVGASYHAYPFEDSAALSSLNTEPECDSLAKMVVALMDDNSPSSEKEMFSRMLSAKSIISHAQEPGADVFDVLQRGLPSVDWSKFDHLRFVS